MKLKLDLGIRQLFYEWKELLTTQGLRKDAVAGITVACISIPLSLAIALASGVEPAVGLVTAIVASVVCTLFGGTPLALSGPAASMAVLIAAVDQDYGLGGLLFVGFGCGFLQLLTGILGLGQIVRFVPVPVIAGFTAGIGAIVLITQLPRALGLPPPDQSHLLEVITHIRDLLHETRLNSLMLAMSTIGITFILPHYLPRLPAPLIAVLIPSLAVGIFGIEVQCIGNIPSFFPSPKLPYLPKADWFSLLGTTIIVFSVASLETLLSSSVIDKFTKSRRHDPNQELIGQGLANMASSLFGGIPVTGVIARSALNIQAGAKTRRSGVIHSFVLITAVYFLAPMLSRIPVAVLAGVLLSVALRMLHPRELIQLWRSSQGDALIYLITFFVILFVDLIIGMQAGVVAALIIAAIRFGRTDTMVHIFDSEGPSVVSIDGPLTFLSSSKIESIHSKLKSINPTRGVVIDMSEVKSIDSSGASQLVELLEHLMSKNIKFAVKGLSPECRKVIFPLDECGRVLSHIASSEMDVMNILGKNTSPSNLNRLAYGVERFRKELHSSYQTLFKNLASGQSPHTLFITCSDSRINPNLITSTDPGELFIVRNVGNIIPPFGINGSPAEGAAVEYAIGVLGVKDIVVCGHSGCGAMMAILSDSFFSDKNKAALPSLVNWLQGAQGVKQQVPHEATPEQAGELNAVLQIENLKTYPIIQQSLRTGKVRLHAWFYNIGDALLEEWDDTRQVFITIGSEKSQSLEKRMEAGIQFQIPFDVSKNR